MQNGTITCYLPYNILSSSNSVVNVCIEEYRFIPGRIQGVLRVLEHPPPLIFRVVIFQQLFHIQAVSDMLVPAPPHLNVYPFLFKGLVSEMHHWRH